MLLTDHIDRVDILLDIGIAHRDTHSLSAQDVGWPDEDRIAESLRCFFSFRGGIDGVARGTADVFLFKDLVKTFPVLRSVHPLGGCSEDRNAHLHEGLREADGRLPAELHDRPVRLLEKDDIPDIFRRERLKIEPVSDVKICRDSLRIVVYDDRLISLFLEGPGRVHTTEIELDPLTDPDRAAAEDEDLLLFLGTVICSFLCCLL